ncbi:hypothetical protein M4D79_07325 [Mycolicibacterium novocastrense]|nr:hypothetical protein M4D79_07325 [Mycolicibacterium novocastrense]
MLPATDVMTRPVITVRCTEELRTAAVPLADYGYAGCPAGGGGSRRSERAASSWLVGLTTSPNGGSPRPLASMVPAVREVRIGAGTDEWDAR